MRKIRTAVVGLGRLGALHAENVARHVLGAKLAALCDADEGRLAESGERHGIENLFTDFDSLLGLDGLEALVVVSPSAYHPEHIDKALAAGMHVFCEKPLGITVEDCLRAERAVTARPDLVFMLGFMRRFDASYAYAHAKVAAGEIGRVILFRGYGQDPESMAEGAIRYAPNSGGIFLDLAVHDIDLARWFVGAEPVELWAVGDCYAHPEFAACGDVDNGACMMRFANGALGFLLAGRTAPHGYNVQTEIIGTKGILRIASVSEKNLVEILDGGGVRRECHQHFIERFGASYLAELEEFISCIIEGRKPGVSVQDGTRCTQIAHKCKESLASGGLVKTGL